MELPPPPEKMIPKTPICNTRAARGRGRASIIIIIKRGKGSMVSFAFSFPSYLLGVVTVLSIFGVSVLARWRDGGGGGRYGR